MAFLAKIYFTLLGWFLLPKKNPFKIGCLGLKSTRMLKLLGGAYWKIQHMQIQVYPQTSIKPEYGEFNLKNEVGAHRLVLLVQLS